MEQKKGPLRGIIKDAVGSMDLNSYDQKAVNLRTTDESRSNAIISNAQKSSEVFSKNNKSKDFYSENSANPEDYILWFSDISNRDVKTAGGKGASLGEMFNNKFPVPPGFVITAQAFDYFITNAGLKKKISDILEKVDVQETEELNNISKQIRKLIEEQKIPRELESEILEAYRILSSEKIDKHGISLDALNILKNSQEPIFVSVRSSATTEDLADASFAGQQESFLNVKGEHSLIEKIKKCFSSLYTPRAIYYRKKKGFAEGESLLAVVIQKMIDSDKSGVVFSRDPVNLDDNIVVEAVFGLGEGIVSGKIKPDNYKVSRDLEIKGIKIADKKIAVVRTGSGEDGIVKLSSEKSKTQVLTNSQIKLIAEYVIALEEHYKKPQDVEFAIETGDVYIVQSRPITTLKPRAHSKTISGNIILEGLGSSPGIGSGIVRIIKSMDDLPKIKKGEVLVTEMTNPDMVVAMQKSTAIVTDEGGMTAHASIVSREMGIPAVVGTNNATSVLKDGMKITVDGYRGLIYEGEIAETHYAEVKQASETKRIKLKLIIDLPEFAERAAQSGIDSVGLLRLEGIIAGSGKHPLLYEKENTLGEYTKLLADGIEKISRHFNSIWIRTSDIRTDEFGSLKGAPEKEINPMLGFHGIRFSLKHPKIFEAELNAARINAEKFPEKKFGLMFPQIIGIEEVREAKKYFEKFKTSNMCFGVMIETPAAVQIIEDISREVDFVSFGTNDLTQYTLAVDRGEEEVQYLYNELHPAIFSQINRVIRTCRENKVETSICGQAGSKKEMIEFLFRKGINSISVNADAAYEISELIRKLEEENKIQKGDFVNYKKENNFPVERENNFKDNQNPHLNFRSNQNRSPAKQRKWEKWKEKKRKWKEQHWNKKAEVYVGESDKKKEGLIDKDKIKIHAEIQDKNFPEKEYKQIEDLDNLDKIEQESEEIQKEVRQENMERVREDIEKEKDIEVQKEEFLEDKNTGSAEPEKIGIYKPSEREKPKQSYSYNFDEE